MRSRIATLTNLVLTGPGDIGVVNPYTLPLAVAPGAALGFTLNVPEGGAIQITESVLWRFTDVPEVSTTLLVTGSRIALFAFDPDWSEPVRERSGYLTAIMTALSDKEQRVQLRKTPRPSLAFRVFTTSPEESALLGALLAQWQARLFGVPLWPDAQPLRATAAPGSTTLLVDTTYRRFAAGSTALLWRGPSTCEAVEISAVGSGSLALSSPTQNAWPADGNTWVLPIVLGRLPNSVELQKVAAEYAQADVTFACEVV